MKSPIQITPDEMHTFMGHALDEAKKARDQNEVPVGAVIVHRGEIIARAHNETECKKNPTAHAECLAIQQASSYLNNWRLSECALFVTLEPCTMCIGAIQLSRIPLLVFGAREEKMGAVGSLYDLTARNEQIRVVSDIRSEESSELLTSFFKTKR